MIDEELMKEYRKECDKATSRFDMPQLGHVRFPICCSCKYADYSDGYNPQCAKHGDMPRNYRFGVDYECPDYELDPNCPKSRLPTPPEKR